MPSSPGSQTAQLRSIHCLVAHAHLACRLFPALQSDNSGRKLSEDVFWFAKQVGWCVWFCRCVTPLRVDVFWFSKQVDAKPGGLLAM